MSSKNLNEASIFNIARRIEAAADREAYLAEMCQGNAALRERVDKLLSAFEAESQFLEQPAAELGATEHLDPSIQDRGDALKAGLAAAFTVDEAILLGDGHHSVLKMLGLTLPNVPRVTLRESAGEVADPIVRPMSAEMPDRQSDNRFQLQGEIARGGMGAILKGRDTDLGRDLAIKVLLDTHKNKPEVVQRFIEEAQIGGQLQHPGIAPIYELGQFADKRPFFAMKLIKGNTLSVLLAERQELVTDRAKFVGIFEQVCQTMAYVHSRGVIHRDLKPANIMVGAFGEVQVMDWGLAKVLKSGGTEDEKKSRQVQQGQSVVQTLRSIGSDVPGKFGSTGSGGSETQMGSVMGTPAYMPPEQALGEIDRLDERSDVFGLGAILSEILTGKPAYAANDGTEIFRLASRGKVSDCFARLDACGADEELIKLAKHCLELEPKDRPRDAGVLAERVSNYMGSVETRLREVELARVAAEARVTEEHKRRRVTMALATSVLLTMGLVGAGTMWIQRQRAELAAVEIEQQHEKQIQLTKLANQISSELATAQVLIKTETDDDLPDPSAVQRAWEAAQRAKKLLADDEHATSLHQAANELLSQLSQLQRDQKLIQDLEVAWQLDLEYRAQRNWSKNSSQFTNNRNKEKDDPVEREGLILPPPVEPEKAYRKAFAEWGLDLETTSVADAVQLLGTLRKTLKPMAIASLDGWGSVLQEPWTIAKWQQAIWHNLQPKELSSRGSDKLTVLEDKSILASGENAGAGYDLVFDTDVTELSALRLEVLLHPSLPNLGPGRDPGGVFWVSGLKVEYAPHDDLESKTQLVFDSAIADHSWRELPITRNQWHIGGGGGRPYVAVFQGATTIRSASGFRIWISNGDRARGRWSNQNLGRFRWSTTRTPSLSRQIEQLQKIASLADADPWRQAVRQDLKTPDIVALTKRLSDTQEVERQPVQFLTHLAASLSLLKGNALMDALPKSIRWSGLENLKVESTNGSAAAIQEDGTVLISGPNPESELLRIHGSFENQRITGVRLDLIATPSVSSDQHSGETEVNWGRGSSVRFREISALVRDPDGATSRLRPSFITSNHPDARNLDVAIDGNSYTSTQMFPEGDSVAIIVGVDSRELNPKQVVEMEIACGRGSLAGRALRQFKVSVTEDELAFTDVRESSLNILQRVVQKFPKDFWARLALIDALMDRGEPQAEEAMRHATAAIALRPEHSGGYAAMLRSIPFDRTVDNPMYQQMLRQFFARLQSIDAGHPALSEVVANFILLGSSLNGKDQIDQAIEAYKKAIEYDPKNYLAHMKWGWVLSTKKGQNDKAIVVYRKFLEHSKGSASMHMNLGICLGKFGQLDDAIVEYQKAIEIDPNFAQAHYNLGILLYKKGLFDKAIKEFRKAIEIDPNDAGSYVNLGAALNGKGLADEAITASRKAIELDPKSAIAHSNLGNSLKTKGQADEAIAEFQKAIEIDPKFAFAHMNLGNSLKDKGQVEAAIAEYRKALEIDPKCADAHNSLGIILHDNRQVDDAISEYRKAIDLDPKNANTHQNLGNSLKTKGETDEAIAEYRKALEIDPKHALTHYNLGHALHRKGHVEEAIAKYKKAIDLDPQNPQSASAHVNLGNLLNSTGRADEAIAAYKQAIEIDPKHTLAHYNLGHALQNEGQLEDAIEEYRIAIQLNPNLAAAKQGLNDAQSAAQIPSFLKGEFQPSDNSQRIGLANACYDKKLYHTAVGLYVAAFDADPKLTDDRETQYAYNSACCAALATTAQCEDAIQLEDSDRTRLRKQAFDWLTVELQHWRMALDTGSTQRVNIAQTLSHWQKDSDLASIRDADALAKLEANEQEAFSKLWADVAELLKQAETPAAKKTTP